ncbi:MAG: ribosome maturation factor RimP [Cytophagales bacterium]|nr:ribosome maturation factor RimP [Bernardetiaceae bacterium]MDW8210405.1 ribosome maturation factor RimP [Cytophagales bacterium]
MEVSEKVAQYVEGLLLEHQFLVEVLFAQKGTRAKLTVVLDSDRGITIDECAQVSQQLSAWLQEQDLIKSNYVLEVSSPGVGEPLKLKRQYHANIGRTLQVNTATGALLRGKLEQVTEESIVLSSLPVKKIGKNKATQQAEQNIVIPFSQIVKAIVEVSFH